MAEGAVYLSCGKQNSIGFTPVGLTEYAIAMVLAILVVPIVEIVKFFQRKAGK